MDTWGFKGKKKEPRTIITSRDDRGTGTLTKEMRWVPTNMRRESRMP